MPEKEYKWIGWVVEARVEKELPWVGFLYAVGVDKTEAIRKFNNLNPHLIYGKLYKRGIARCVPVYVEVKDG